MFRPLMILVCLLAYSLVNAQTIGGTSIYNFLKLPQHPLSAASGGRIVSSFSNEIGLISENPALLKPINDREISSNITILSPGLSIVNSIFGYHFENLNTTLALSVNHFSYGTIDQTDAAGNTLGAFMPYDQSVQLTASHPYGEKWNYGISLKYINSKYGTYSSSALAADMGLHYDDNEKLFQAGFSAKCMGFQLKTYSGQGEDLPFDISLGINKKLENAPFRFGILAQKIHQFDILYNDTLFNNSNGLVSSKNGFAGKLINHLILSGDILLGDKIVFTLGYNFLRRKELSVQRMANGLAGFSYGMTLSLKRLSFYFSRAHYQSSLAYLHVGITCKLKKN